MKNFKLFNLLIIVFFFKFQSAYSSIVYIDVDFIINNSEIGKISLSKLDTINKKNLDNLKKNQSELRKIENELKKKENIISTEQFDKEIKALKLKFQEFNNEKENMVNDFKKKQKKELGTVLEKINIVIQEYMKTNSIEIVLDKKNIFVGKVSSDITEKILIEVNNRYK